MIEKNFECALWGTSWEEALSDGGQAQGTASFSNKQGATLNIPFGEILTSDFLGRCEPADCLYGFTRDGYYLALRESRSSGTSNSFPGAPKQKVYAKDIMISRQQFDPNGEVITADIWLSGLREWVCAAPYRAKHEKGEERVIYEVSWDISPRIVLREESPRITIEHSLSRSDLSAKGFKVDHDCFIHLQLEKPMSIEDVINTLIHPIREFLSFCIGRYAAIEKVDFFQPGSQGKIGYYAQFLTNGIVTSEYDNMLLPHSRIKDNASKLLETWLSFQEDMRRGATMLTSNLLYTRGLPLDLEFLAVAQTLEALMRHCHGTEELPEHEFKWRLGIVESSIDDPVVKKWALKKLEHSNYLSQRNTLQRHLDGLGGYATFLISDRKTFIARHLVTRNGYTHRKSDSKILSGDELYWHMRTVSFLNIGTMFIQLGFTPDEAVDILKTSHYEWYAVSKVQDLYARKKAS